ncbi:MAG TPA: bifunctional helix-turn-helix transcriptional regulator/GNAT family N-acetyltransferase [Kofleriaceae bacterium]|nr:bifunctional helix-turn-helix transcriptional regulator/GNAT family N-acetyltransferase [Kofleriaceae bacterium]
MLENRVSGSGVTNSQCHALIEIERQGVMAAGELAAVLNLDKSTTSRTVASLVRSGLVAARDDGGDRRRRPLALTAKGRRVLASLHGAVNEQVNGALALLGESERDTVLRGMELYAKALARRRAQQEFAIRPITRKDDPVVAGIVRAGLTEFGATGPGFAIHDPEVDSISAGYSAPGHGYWVLVRRGQVVGGGGFAPLTGGEPGVCELRKMYFTPEARGVGMGARMLAHVLEEASRAGHRTCYLETLEAMVQARRLYESFGFRRIEGPMGATGHFGCDAWYLRDLVTYPVKVSKRRPRTRNEGDSISH